MHTVDPQPTWGIIRWKWEVRVGWRVEKQMGKRIGMAGNR